MFQRLVANARRDVSAFGVRRVGVSACRRVGVSACRRVGVSAFGVRRSAFGGRGGPEFSGTRANFRMTSHLFVFVADIPWNGRI
jgi:hypothetical protein